LRGIGDYIVVYDISSDKERAKVDKILKGFGFRVQKSVFECRMSKHIKKELLKKLETLNLKTGFILIYKREYSSKAISIGIDTRKINDTDNVFII